ncbi:hypothetical protein PQR53_27860 [Paraburkholderia fungorum]|uniref:hypothetical protein n=1 Tax=Paraburkholderia fungorum TaxID=134537 RepID=UPI0038BDD687
MLTTSLNEKGDQYVIADTSGLDRETIPGRQSVSFANRSARERAFLDLWKQAVAIAGCEYFGDGTDGGLQRAQTKTELTPRMNTIHAAIVKDRGEDKVFLAVVASFCFAEGAQPLWDMLEIRGLADVSTLSQPKKHLIGALISTFDGWY